jgi:hypothetical protein
MALWNRTPVLFLHPTPELFMTVSPARPWHASYQQVGIAPELEPLPYRNLAELAHESCKKWQTESKVKAAFSCVVPNGMNGRLSFAQVDEALGRFCRLPAGGGGAQGR